MKSTTKIKEFAGLESNKNSLAAADEDISILQNREGRILPVDLVEYFKLFNGTSGAYNERFFCFYSLREFKTLKEKFKDWNGIPKYKNIVDTLEGYDNYYAFADYEFHLLTYAIKLYEKETARNEVLVICGGEFKLIGDSFTTFIEKYLANSDDLQF